MADFHTFQRLIAGKTLEVQIGKLANQTNSSVFVQYGDTSVLVTAVMSEHDSSGDFLPLSVEYQERFYAAGKIKGSRFVKREGRPSEESVLTGRLIDRAIRPFFDQRIRREIQIVVTVLSLDKTNDADIPALFGASLALSISDIPWSGPVTAMRVGKLSGDVILNPSFEDREHGEFDIVLALNSKEEVVMMEASAKRIPHQEIMEALQVSKSALQEMISLQQEVVSVVGVTKQQIIFGENDDQELRSEIESIIESQSEDILYGPSEKVRKAKRALIQELKDQYPDHHNLVHQVLDQVIEQTFKRNILVQERRPDGRSLTEVRPISAEIDILPRVHGVGLFNRGNTQTLSVLTLGAPGESQIIDEMEQEYKKHFMHHYNFPPFSVGETRPFRGPGRREIGHGALAEKALDPVIPSTEQFPYTIRIVTEVLSSNGSSSMASVSSSSLALYAAGVPITEPVAGIAMGIVTDSDKGKYKILTDIQGPEDHYGEMDLKIAGTRMGITAIQMDVKQQGITFEILDQALKQAYQARISILDTMDQVLNQPRKDISPQAPKIMRIIISPQKIGEVIGPGGKTINKIIQETEVKIDIEDDGTVFITGEDMNQLNQAVERIKALSYEPKEGAVFQGKVVKIMPFGAFINLQPGLDGLLHISEIADQRLDNVESVIQLGQVLEVVIKKIDSEGKINLALTQKIKLNKG